MKRFRRVVRRMKKARKADIFDKAKADELLREFMLRGCGPRRRAVLDECSEDDAEVVMEIFGLSSGPSEEDVDDAKNEGREEGAEEEREKLLAQFGELGWTVSPEAQARVRDYLWREHGITNVYAARMF